MSNVKFQFSQDDINFIKNLLRQGSVKWKGRAECLKRARKPVLERVSKDGLPVYKFHWLCAHCKVWTRNEKLMEVDHVVEVGPFEGDWNAYMRRLFPPIEGLQVLCYTCHLKKTTAYNSARTRWKRKT